MTEANNPESVLSPDLEGRLKLEAQLTALYWARRFTDMYRVQADSYATSDRYTYQEAQSHIAQWGFTGNYSTSSAIYLAQLQADEALQEEITQHVQTSMQRSPSDVLLKQKGRDFYLENLAKRAYGNGAFLLGEFLASQIEDAEIQWSTYLLIYKEHGWKGIGYERTRYLAGDAFDRFPIGARRPVYVISQRDFEREADRINRTEAQCRAQGLPVYLISNTQKNSNLKLLTGRSPEELIEMGVEFASRGVGALWKVAELTRISSMLLRSGVNPERFYDDILRKYMVIDSYYVQNDPDNASVAVQGLFDLGFYKEAYRLFKLLSGQREIVKMGMAIDYIAVEYGVKVVGVLQQQLQENPDIIHEILADTDNAYVLYTLAREGIVTLTSPDEAMFQGNTIVIDPIQFSALILGQRDRAISQGVGIRQRDNLYTEWRGRCNGKLAREALAENQAWDFAYTLLPQLYLRPQWASPIGRAFVLNESVSVEIRMFVVNAMFVSQVWDPQLKKELEFHFDKVEERLDVLVQILERSKTMHPDMAGLSFFRNGGHIILPDRLRGERHFFGD